MSYFGFFRGNVTVIFQKTHNTKFLTVFPEKSLGSKLDSFTAELILCLWPVSIAFLVYV